MIRRPDAWRVRVCVVALVVVAAQRELEAVLARGRPVAGAAGAAELREDRLDVVAEARACPARATVHEQQSPTDDRDGENDVRAD